MEWWGLCEGVQDEEVVLGHGSRMDGTPVGLKECST